MRALGRKIKIIPILAYRFLLSRVSDRFLSLIAWVSVIGVALGVLALVVVTSVINGFEGELVRVITGMNGDVILYSRGEPISDVRRIEDKVRKVLPNVMAMTDSFVTELMVSGPIGPAGAVLEGIDTRTVGSVTMVPQRVVTGRLPEKEGEVALGSAIANRIGAREGNEIRLVIPFAEQPKPGGSAREGTDLGTPKIFKMNVVGTVSMGMYEYDSKFVYATLPVVQGILKQEGKITMIKIKLLPGSDTREASDRLADNFGYPFRAKDWGQLNQNLFYAIKLEKAVIAIILTVIVLVAAFNVVSTLMMMIHDKSKEIAILKAMGLRASQGFQLFCLIGMGIGLTGACFGITIGLGVNWALKRTRLIDLPADIYYIGYLPVVTRWKEITLIGLGALLICFLATLYPSWKVARRSPLDGLRYE